MKSEIHDDMNKVIDEVIDDTQIKISPSKNKQQI